MEQKSELIELKQGVPELTDQAITLIKLVEGQLKEVKQTESDLKTSLLESMKKYGIKSIKLDGLALNVVASGEKEHFDSKKFREENPELYDKYVEFVQYAESLRIKI